MPSKRYVQNHSRKGIPIYMENLDSGEVIVAKSKTEVCMRYLGRSYNHFLDRYRFLDSGCCFEIRVDSFGDVRGELPLGSKWRFHSVDPREYP